MSIDQSIQAITNFQGLSLTESLSTIETAIIGLNSDQLRTFCASQGIDNTFMLSAASIKKIAGQINVIIHAAGILCSLPSLLKPRETVQSVSLGAGNAGRQFDLETNLRVAEYKFADWQGGAESIRQNGVFNDFYGLAEHQTTKSKHLYVVDCSFPLKFLTGRRALTSVLSRYPTVLQRIKQKYGSDVLKVRDYYNHKKSEVEICDVTPYICCPDQEHAEPHL